MKMNQPSSKKRVIAIAVILAAVVIIGAVIYRTIICFALTLPKLKPTDLKLITAVIVAFALALPVFKSKAAALKNKRSNKEAA